MIAPRPARKRGRAAAVADRAGLAEEARDYFLDMFWETKDLPPSSQPMDIAWQRVHHHLVQAWAEPEVKRNPDAEAFVRLMVTFLGGVHDSGDYRLPLERLGKLVRSRSGKDATNALHQAAKAWCLGAWHALLQTERSTPQHARPNKAAFSRWAEQQIRDKFQLDDIDAETIRAHWLRRR